MGSAARRAPLPGAAPAHRSGKQCEEAAKNNTARKLLQLFRFELAEQFDFNMLGERGGEQESCHNKSVAKALLGAGKAEGPRRWLLARKHAKGAHAKASTRAIFAATLRVAEAWAPANPGSQASEELIGVCKACCNGAKRAGEGEAPARRKALQGAIDQGLCVSREKAHYIVELCAQRIGRWMQKAKHAAGPGARATSKHIPKSQSKLPRSAAAPPHRGQLPPKSCPTC